MTLFREHRGGLDESMDTAIDLDDRDALVSYAQQLLAPYGFEFEPHQLHVEPYCRDERIKWDTHIVTIDGYGVLGFTDGPL